MCVRTFVRARVCALAGVGARTCVRACACACGRLRVRAGPTCVCVYEGAHVCARMRVCVR